MIKELRLANIGIFRDPVKISFEADMRTKRLGANVHQTKAANLVKTLALYGPNNAGKTNVISCMRSLCSVLLNQGIDLHMNFYSHSSICSMGVTFVLEDKEFSFDFQYDVMERGFVSERFSQFEKEESGKILEKVVLNRDIKNSLFVCQDKTIESMMHFVSKDNLLIYLIDVASSADLVLVKQKLVEFASSVEILDMNHLKMEHTISVLQTDEGKRARIVDFIKQSDCYLDDVYVASDNDFLKHYPKLKSKKISQKEAEGLPTEWKLTSVYHSLSVPSVLFDSIGTQKIEALASYVIDALDSGKILFIDELDSSLHFTLTRAIVAMFNNELNGKAQMFFTTHDVSLLDCKKLLRKEQIWFIHKDKDCSVSVYPLSMFTSRDGVRETTDWLEKYKKGILGALPDPDFFQTLLESSNA